MKVHRRGSLGKTHLSISSGTIQQSKSSGLFISGCTTRSGCPYAELTWLPPLDLDYKGYQKDSLREARTRARS